MHRGHIQNARDCYLVYIYIYIYIYEVLAEDTGRSFDGEQARLYEVWMVEFFHRLSPFCFSSFIFIPAYVSTFFLSLYLLFLIIYYLFLLSFFKFLFICFLFNIFFSLFPVYLLFCLCLLWVVIELSVPIQLSCVCQSGWRVFLCCTYFNRKVFNLSVYYVGERILVSFECCQ